MAFVKGDRVRFANPAVHRYLGKAGVVLEPANSHDVVVVQFDDMTGLIPGTSTVLSSALEYE